VFQSRLTWTSAAAARRFPAQADLYLAMTRRVVGILAVVYDRRVQCRGLEWRRKKKVSES